MPCRRGGEEGNGSPRNQLKESKVKKIALTLVAISALGLAACQDNADSNEAAEDNVEAAMNEAEADSANALEAAGNALDAAGNLVENAGEAVENAAEQTGEALENATK